MAQQNILWHTDTPASPAEGDEKRTAKDGDGQRASQRSSPTGEAALRPAQQPFGAKQPCGRSSPAGDDSDDVPPELAQNLGSRAIPRLVAVGFGCAAAPEKKCGDPVARDRRDRTFTSAVAAEVPLPRRRAFSH
jgi:hypothetical protein